MPNMMITYSRAAKLAAVLEAYLGLETPPEWRTKLIAVRNRLWSSGLERY